MGFRGFLATLGVGMVVSLSVSGVASVARADVERPPQFVMLAFDNCTELERWKDLSGFSAAMNQNGDRVHFTFFVSGINFIEDADRNVYQGPGQRRGYSRINFGGSAEDVCASASSTSPRSTRAGHEIASHAVGHFNGAHWSAAQWEQEFGAYHGIVENAGPAPVRASEDHVDVPLAKIVGFRAPYLATGPGLYEALRHERFRYDTSGITYADQWPRKTDGLWRFDLMQVKVSGLGRNTLSMDYNFLVAQSHGVVDARRAETFKAQMLATYRDYFRASYAGNRAPLNIGHHFEAYQGGVYNEALKDFAREVCGLPEVKCATYRELADFMDRQSPETIAAYQQGAFPHAVMPTVSAAALAR